MEHRKPSKVTQKDRYGNMVTYEYAPEIKPMDHILVDLKDLMQFLHGSRLVSSLLMLKL